MFSSKDTISSEVGELKGQEQKASGCGDRDWLLSDIHMLGWLLVPLISKAWA